MKTFLAALALLVAAVASPVLVQAQVMNVAGEEVGTDPDPFIRGQLLRDSQWKTGG
jgi:hypothetical protein